MGKNHTAAPVMTEFIFGEQSFVSRGTVKLTVRRGGETEEIAVPIRSIGVVEIRELIEKDRPVPPARTELIKKDSEQGEQLGLAEDWAARVLDYTDETYRRQMAEYSDRLYWGTIIAGLDVVFKKPGGEQITDPAAIRRGLEDAGITGRQLDRLYASIVALSRAGEETADFLSESASGSARPSGRASRSAATSAGRAK